MYKRNQYINRLKRFSNKKLILIAQSLGLEDMSPLAKTFIDKKGAKIVIYKEDHNYSYKKGEVNFSAIFLKEFSATNDAGKDLSRKYRRLMCKFFPKYEQDYNNYCAKQISKQSSKNKSQSEKTL